MNVDYSKWVFATGTKDAIPLQPSDRRFGFNIPASAPTVRKERRALVKALGSSNSRNSTGAHHE